MVNEDRSIKRDIKETSKRKFTQKEAEYYYKNNFKK